MKNLKIAYFSGEPIGVPVLEELKEAGIIPDLIVCNPDRKQGRKMELTAPPSKKWAEEQNIPVFQPESLKNKEDLKELSEGNFDLFLVVAYSKILPLWLIELPKHKTLNVHPSLLPKLRGPNPIRESIIENNKDQVGVSIMLLDEQMDHGPILDQTHIDIARSEWPMKGADLDMALARLGGTLLAETIPAWISGSITPQEQNHQMATYTKKLQKADGELAIDPHNLPTGDEALDAFLKIRAYDGYPGTFFFHEGKRIKISDADMSSGGNLLLTSVIPEGKNKMYFEDWLQN